MGTRYLDVDIFDALRAELESNPTWLFTAADLAKRTGFSKGYVQRSLAKMPDVKVILGSAHLGPSRYGVRTEG